MPEISLICSGLSRVEKKESASLRKLTKKQFHLSYGGGTALER
jgi:hypothetical protein